MNILALGNLKVETSEHQSPGESLYHAILDDGAEVAKVHPGDDIRRTRKLAEVMSKGPELHEALSMMLNAFNDVPFSGPRATARIDAVAMANTLLRELR